MPQYDYDLFVIGGGSGGVRAARVSAALGKRVAIAEEYRFGGTCVIRGCVPKKLLVYASQFPEHFEDAAGYGWTVPEASFDWPTLIANKDHEIGRLEDIYQHGVEKAGGADLPFPRRAGRQPHDPHREREPHGHRRPDPDRHRRPAQPACRAARPRALHLLQRGVRPASTAEGDRHCRRRLYRGRVRQHLPRPRRRDDADLSRPRDPAALRHGSAAQGLHEAMESKGIRILCHTIFERIDKRADGRLDAQLSGRQGADRRPDDAGDRPHPQHRKSRAGGGRRQDRQARRDHRRRLFAHQCRQHLGDRRRHQPRAADAGGDPRGDVLRRDGVQGQSDRAPTTTPSRPPSSRSPRSARSACPRTMRPSSSTGWRSTAPSFRPMRSTLAGPAGQHDDEAGGRRRRRGSCSAPICSGRRPARWRSCSASR